MDDLVAAVRRSLSGEAAAEFDDRVEAGAAFLREELESGTLSAPDFAVGMELEAYAVDPEGRPTPLPASVFEDGPAKELGVHNVECNTPPTRFDAAGLERQAALLDERWVQTESALAEANAEPVLDAMWTTPPAGGSTAYLSAVERRDGVTLAENMRLAPRYCAIDNEVLGWADGEIPLEFPGVDVSFPTILFESLATSIQPHLQIPDLDRYPAYYNAGIRTLGPVLALSTNSPFLPADLYETDDPDSVVVETPHECRIPVFEGAINVDDGPAKVRLPRDIDHVTDVVDRLVADRVCAPFLQEWTEPGAGKSGNGDDEGDYADQFWELDHKRGTYWRWLRSVVGGDPVEGAGDGRSIRIEYRPLPTQPSVDGTVALQFLVVGLLRGLVEAEHPIRELDWERAHDAFYDAVDRGPAMAPAWITADGDANPDREAMYADILDVARSGLRAAGLDDATIDARLGPVSRRVDRIGTDRPVTPSAWKKQRVREALDAGATLQDAITEMQATYRARTGTPFVDWAD
jgi:hypothetical protein